MKRILFVCGKNKRRSPTAEAVFRGREGIEVDSAGLSRDADVVLSAEQIEWADVIFVMERAHRDKLVRAFERQLRDRRVIVLGIPDDYDAMDPRLIALLEKKVTPLL